MALPGFRTSGNFTQQKVVLVEGLMWNKCIIWAPSQENLSSGFPSKRDSNQSPQLQRLARKLKFHQHQVYI